MPNRYLQHLFTPETVVVIGASEKPDSVGGRVFLNIQEAGYKGELLAIHPDHQQVYGRPCYSSIAEVHQPVDLAVIVTPAYTVPELIQACGEQGVSAAIVISAGFAETGPTGEKLQQRVVSIARQYGIRMLGPNCLGLMRPDIGLNATFSQGIAQPGHLALVSQSGALCTSILDWAQAHHIGFSAMVALGDAADIGFGDALEYLAMDPQTHSILLYVEGIRHARRFLSGLRVAARMKPVVVVKAGRHAAGSRAAISHTGALVGADDVFDAALERTGAVRAYTVGQLFSAAQVLTSGNKVQGNRLAIVSNAGGPGVMATDRAVEVGITMVELEPSTVETLNTILPSHWSHGNPVDILGDATPQRYQQALSAVLKDPQVDGVLVMLTPQAMTQPTEAAQAVIEVSRNETKPVMVCWMGEQQVQDAHRLFLQHQIPHFSTPEESVEAFSYLANYRHNQQLLMQVPGPLSDRRRPDIEGAQMIMEGALSAGRKTLSAIESKAVLQAFRIPTNTTMLAHSAHEALVAAESIGFPVAMKIQSPTLTHKMDVGGVRLGINDAQSVRRTFQEMTEDIQRFYPGIEIEGVTVERMSQPKDGRELLVGMVHDPAFGPVICFGAGGTQVEVIRDRAVALPPLNQFIIHNMVERTRISQVLGAFRHMPPVHQGALENVLLRVSEMVCELPLLRELDINPLLVHEHGAIAVDARIVIDSFRPHHTRYGHMALHPYPSHLSSTWQLSDGTDIIIRPIRPEDAEIERAFVRNLSSEAKYFRFMRSLQELTTEMLVRFTQLDYDRELAMIAVTQDNGQETELGVARYFTHPNGKNCEFAIVIADEWQRKGLGSQLMQSLIAAARAQGIEWMEGDVLSENTKMLHMMKKLGFSAQPLSDDPSIQHVTLSLQYS